MIPEESGAEGVGEGKDLLLSFSRCLISASATPPQLARRDTINLGDYLITS